MNLETLAVGDHVQYTGEEIKGNRWIWRGHVTRVTWKYAYILWTHSNSPVFGGEVTKDDEGKTARGFRRNAADQARRITRIL